MSNFRQTAAKLAAEYVAVLHVWLTADELAQIYAGTSYPDDFCDGNMAMDEAFTKVMEREFVFNDDEKPETEALNQADTTLVNAAYSIAKIKNFKKDA